MREYVIGERVECDGNRGTVLFVGEVPPTKGSWLGVEWDDPARGKHNGCHEGTQYFVTRNVNAGSFVRVNKIQPPMDFCQALSERYLRSSTDGFADKLLINELRDEMNAPFLELVGFEKVGRQQSNLNELRIAVLDHMCISHSKSDLKEVCPRIEELNLSSNLFNSWVSIAELTGQLPNLQVLNVSDNKLVIPENPRSLEAAFRNLKQLTIGNMDYTWKDIVKCSTMWPKVEILAAPNNNMKCLEFMDNDIFSYLRVLNLEGNSIENWEEVNKLGQLPNLEQLSLYGCGLKNIQVKEKSFPKLTKLSLSNNNISQWQHISELDKLPSLVDLKLCGNQGLEGNSYETFSQWIIARVGNLKVLNGTEISNEDRRGAELDYLKNNGKEYLTALPQNHSTDQNAWKDFQARHPRYNRLVEKYGPPEKDECEVKPTTLRSTLILLQLQWGSSRVSKKLPLTMEVQKLKTLCHRLFDLDSSELTLYSFNMMNPDLYVPLDNDLRPLSFYSVEHGDIIVVKES